jgi:hypothetical protein
MIVLTGDIHHMTLRTPDQARLPRGVTEASACEKYLEIANEAAIEPTIYASGRLAQEEHPVLLRLCKNFRLELGGHTYTCMKPPLLYAFSRRVLRRANGPSFYQSMEIAKTLDALAPVTRAPIRSWRNHAYSYDCNTVSLLARHGVRSVSNQVAADACVAPIDTSYGRIWNIPINTPPDHENLHPDIGNEGNSRFSDVTDWATEVLRQIERNELASTPSVILAHPACMEVADGMVAFKWLVSRLPADKCVTVSRLVDPVMNRPLT